VIVALAEGRQRPFVAMAGPSVRTATDVRSFKDVIIDRRVALHLLCDAVCVADGSFVVRRRRPELVTIPGASDTLR
jgi:hypothetical protein